MIVAQHKVSSFAWPRGARAARPAPALGAAGNCYRPAHMTSRLGWLFLVLFVIQNSSNAVLGQYAMQWRQPFESRTSVLMQEILKLSASTVLYTIECGGAAAMVRSLAANAIERPASWVHVGVPAVVYTIGATLQFESAKHLDTGVAGVLMQTNKLFVAGLSVMLLGRKLLRFQWCALILLTAGISAAAMPSVGRTKHGGLHHAKGNATSPFGLQVRHRADRNFELGAAQILGAALCSAFATVYFEMTIKRGAMERTPPSLWFFNMQLAIISIFMATAEVVAHRDPRGMFHDFDMVVWIVIASGATGGLFVAMILKHADSILRGFGSAASLILASAGGWFFLGTPLPSIFISGTCLVLFSLWLFLLLLSPLLLVLFLPLLFFLRGRWSLRLLLCCRARSCFWSHFG